MSQYGPGDKPPVVRRRARRVRRRPPRPTQTPAAAETQRQVATGKIKPPRATKPIHAVAPAPKTDVQSSGADYGTHEAERHKQKADYRADVRKTYVAASPKRKRQLLTAAAKHPDRPENQVILHEHKSRVERNKELAAGQAVHDVVTDADLKKVNAYKQSDEYKSLVEKSKPKPPKQKASDIYLTDRNALAAAGFKVDKADAAFEAPARVAVTALKTAKLTAETAAEDPKQIPKLAGDTAKSVIGIPAGLLASGLHPKKAVKAIAKDYERRYGDLYENKPGAEKKFKARQKKEGIAPEVFDLAGAVSGPVLGAAGKGLQTVARAGAIGKRAERIATAERAAVRVSGGTTVQPELSSNFLKNVKGRGVDAARRRAVKRRVAKAEAGGRQLEPHVREAAERGEGVFLRSPASKIGLDKTARKARKAVGQQKSVRHQQQKIEQQTEITKGAEKNLARLKKRSGQRDAFKYVMQLGIPADNPKRAVAELKKHRARIVAERERMDAEREAAGKPPFDIPKQQDELPVIDRIIKNADRIFTPKLREVVEEERGRGERLAVGDPGVSEETAMERRVAAQAEHLGEERGGVPVGEAVKVARRDLKQAKKARQRTGKAVTRQERIAGRTEGRADVRVGQADRRTEAQIARAERSAEIHERSAANYERRAATARKPENKTERLEKAKAARERAEVARGRADDLKAVHNRKPRGTLRVAERNEGEALFREQAVKAANDRVSDAKVNLADAKRAKREGKRRVGEEPVEDFVARVQARAKEAGLEDAGYVPSKKRPEGVFSAHAVGGVRGVAGPGDYSGTLFRTGRESVDPDTYTTGLAQNIKRKYNWNLVSDNFDNHTFEWSRGKTLNELKDELERRNIDPNSVAFWNPGVFRQLAEKADDGIDTDPNLPEELGDNAVHGVVTNSARKFNDLGTLPDEFSRRRDWGVVPRSVYDEIHADTKQSGVLGRSFDVAKGKASRYLLANPAWLQFQIASNALLTGIAGTGPVDALKAQRWWSKLSDDEKMAIEPYIGVTKWHDDQTKLGATSHSTMVNSWRAFKRTSFYQSALSPRPGNVLDMLFKADNAQNNFFRKAVFYNQAKKAAYRNMGKNASGMAKTQNRLAQIMRMTPDEQMKAIIDNPQMIVQHAKHVNDFLGDYLSYTSKERRILGRSVMFYGFLRFSLRFMFYTMPAKHPLMSSVFAQLGRLHHDELVRIFGGEPPPWQLGNYYSADGKTKIAAQRANPFFNATQYFDLTSGNFKPGQLAGVLPPWGQAIINQVAGKNVFLNQPWKLEGSTQEDRSGWLRAHVFAADFLKGLGPVYNLTAKTGAFGATDPIIGKQGADSYLFHNRPTQFKRGDKIAEAQNAAKSDSARDFAGELADPFGLFTRGTPGGPDIASSQAYQKSKGKRKAKRRGRPRQPGFDIGGGGLGDSLSGVF